MQYVIYRLKLTTVIRARSTSTVFILFVRVYKFIFTRFYVNFKQYLLKYRKKLKLRNSLYSHYSIVHLYRSAQYGIAYGTTYTNRIESILKYSMAPNKRLQQYPNADASSSSALSTPSTSRAGWIVDDGLSSRCDNNRPSFLLTSSDNDDDKHRHRSIRCSSFITTTSSLLSSKKCIVILTLLAMVSVGGGIMVAIFVGLKPLNTPETIIIERSSFSSLSMAANNNNDNNKIISSTSSYDPSSLEAYVIKNGRSNEKLGYDRQIKIKRRTKTTKSSPLMVPPPLIPLSLFSHVFTNKNKNTQVDYGDKANTENMPSGCELWTNRDVTTPEIYNGLQLFRNELATYEDNLSKFSWNWEQQQQSLSGSSSRSSSSRPSKSSSSRDLRDYFVDNGDGDKEKDKNKSVCHSLELHPDGLKGIFKSDSSLSKLPLTTTTENENGNNYNNGGGGFIEPFLPPLRHPEFCYDDSSSNSRTSSGRSNNNKLLDMGYLVHDFAALCRNKLHKHSRTVFVDMGASLAYHTTDGSSKSKYPPTVTLLKLYKKFGFVFDHIYGYELTPSDPTKVYQQIPDEFKAAYHWYNVGVTSDPTSYSNPLKMILDTYTPDDFVVVKLDIDAPHIEIPLAKSLLLHHQKQLANLVDVFYFEHHVTMRELAPAWKDTMEGSIQDSMEFFTSLRQHGIAAHYWI